MPIDRIVENLWPDQPPVDPAANVATLVSRSHRLLGPADAGFTRFRRVAETPFNLVYEARP